MNVAVVIPAFESAAFLPAALRSVHAQTQPPAEVVVVDDGSRDASAVVAARAGARVLRQGNAGPGAARNHGIAVTRAELIAFLDADDVFLPEKLALQAAVLREPGVVACCSDAWLLRDGARAGRKNARRAVPRRLAFADLLAGNPIVCSSVVARRDAVLAAGGFDEDRTLIATEDYDLWLRLARLGTIVYLDQPLLEYRVHAASLSDDRRFVAGIDRIMAKVTAADPTLQARADARRAGARVDAAWHLARRDGAAARALLREARALAARGPRLWRIWLRRWLARGG
jgi:glycosyltransferase involved in cell wall biosynthesis